MTKEEVIKEAWGILMPDYTNIDLKNGWSLDDFHEHSYNENEFHKQQIYGHCKIRPKSLQGIDNNNGWIKIESEDDLPKIEMQECFIIDKKLGIIIGRFALSEINIWLENATHYQPIVKPKPPIY